MLPTSRAGLAAFPGTNEDEKKYMKMRLHKDLNIGKMFLIVGMAFLVSCSQENQPDSVSDNEIVLGLDLSDAWSNSEKSRASIVDNTSFPTMGFGVFAFYTQSIPDFMNNTKVYSDDGGTTWTYKPVKYWPNNDGDKLDFFAYAPYDASFSVTEKSKLTYTYTVPQDVTKQKDLMWSNSDTKGKTKTDGKVSFHFLHALSKIAFSAEAKIEGDSPFDEFERVVMTVKKIVLTSHNDNTGMGDGSFYRQGVLNLDNQTTTPKWSSFSGNQRYELSSANLSNNALTLKKDATSVPAQSLTTDGHYLMIIPQDFTTGPGVDGFNVYVEYEVTLWFKDSGSGNEKNYFTYTNKSTGNLKIKFEPSKAYVINIKMGLEDAILGEVSMSGWEEKTITLPDIVP